MPSIRIGRRLLPDVAAQVPRAQADHRMVRVALIASSLLVLAGIAPAAQAATGETRIIVGRDPGLTGHERADIRRDADVKHVENLRLPDAEVVRTDAPSAALSALRNNPDVRYAAVDRVRHVTADPGLAYQWALDNTGHNLDSTSSDPSAH